MSPVLSCALFSGVQHSILYQYSWTVVTSNIIVFYDATDCAMASIIDTTTDAIRYTDR